MQETAKMKVIIFFIFLGYYTTYKYNKFLINNDKFRLIAIFSGTEVTKDSDTDNWIYTNGGPRYWLYGKTHYFAAFAPTNSPNIGNLNLSKGKDSKSKDIITGSFDYTNTAEEDLIFATYVHNALASSNPEVNFTFKHLLSKVKISFKNSVDPYVKLKISNLQFSIPEMTTITFAEANVCSNIAGSLDVLTFEKNSLEDNSLIVAPNTTGKSEDFFFIPCKRKYEFEFDVTIVMDGVEPTLYTTHMKAIAEGLDKSGVQLDMGAAYNFVTEITPSTIEEGKSSFEVEQIPYWNGKQEGETTVQVFTDLDKIKIASKLGGTVALQNDVPSDGETVEAITVVDDLTILSAVPNDKTAGYTIDYNGTSGYLFNVINGSTATNNGDNITTLTLGGTSDVSSVVSITANGGIATAGPNTEIIINGGKHTTAGETIYESTGGKIEITAGEFQSTSTTRPLALLNGSNGNITVSGGDYYMWDPTIYLNNQTNFDGVNGAYIVRLKDNWYSVGRKVTITSYDMLLEQKGIEDIVEFDINQDIAPSNSVTISFVNKEDVTLNNNADYNINAGGNKKNNSYGLSFNNCTSVVLNDININKGGLSFIYGHKLEINNCTIDLDFNPVSNSDGGRHCIYCGTRYDPKVEVTINSGMFLIQSNAPGHTSYERFIAADVNSIVLIKGGEFYVKNPDNSRVTDGSINTRYGAPFDCKSSSSITISGGTFGFDIRNYLTANVTIVDGCEVIPGTHPEDGGLIWTVQ